MNNLEQLRQELCLKCKKCCALIGIETKHRYEPDLVEFYKTRGFKCYNINGGYLGVVLNFPCPHLTDTGCDIYKNRPNVCRNFDGRENFLTKDFCLWP